MTPGEEAALFQSAVADAVPLTPHGRYLHPELAAPPPHPLSFLHDEHQALLDSLSDPLPFDPETETGEELSYVRPGINRQVLRRLRRGEWVTQAELDLHGLRREEARLELAAFLLECRHRAIRCIRIIHGKGLRSPNREPVLKHHVRHWLMRRDEVLAFVQARPVDGGGGAVVVLLKSRP
ncbi:MAG: Smr/MutS family protein [Betaproteobacteria bacterium]|nr:Smr/MutS family protein [Betaproteobacteria bacterium]